MLNAAHHRGNQRPLGQYRSVALLRGIVIEVNSRTALCSWNSHQPQAHHVTETTVFACEPPRQPLMCRRESARTQSATKSFPDETKDSSPQLFGFRKLKKKKKECLQLNTHFVNNCLTAKSRERFLAARESVARRNPGTQEPGGNPGRTGREGRAQRGGELTLKRHNKETTPPRTDADAFISPL